MRYAVSSQTDGWTKRERQRYTDEEDRMIRDSVEPVTVLARRLGRSAASVYSRRHRLGLTRQS